MDMDPPVYFYANMITADQVAYEPGCPDSGQNEVHSHLASDSALDLGTDGYYTVKEVLDALLCKLRAKHIPYDPTYCDQQHPDLGWDQVKTVQEAINKICEIFGICKDCYEFLDDLRADGIVGNADGKMGFVVTANPEIPLEVEYTGGVAYVAGCRYEIDGGTITVDESTTHQTLAVNEKGQVELFIKTIGSEKYTSIAIISTFQGEIKRIIDVRFDITHLDEKVQQNFQRTAAARIDRRQFVPLLAYSINGLEYLDGRDRSFKLENEPLFDNGIPYGLCSDGDNIWVCNINGPVIAKIPRFAEDMNEIEYIPLTNDGIRGSWAVAYDGCCLWFTLIGLDSVVRLNPKDLEQREITVGKIPTGIAFDGDFIWVCNLGSNNISVIDVETCQIVRTIDLVARPWHVAFDGTYMWVAAENQLFKVEKPWGNPQFVTELTFNRGYLTFDGTHIWVSSRNAPLVKVDVVTGVPQFNVVDSITSTQTLTFDGTHLWAFDSEHMYKIDPQNNSPILWDSPLDEIPFVSLFDGTHIWLSTDKGVLKKLV
jgi:YVTN family beta-propeller protein